VWISSEANGGTVSGSNNAAAGNDATNTATANATQSSETTGGNGKGGGDAISLNHQDVNALNDIDNHARTGDIYAGGGYSDVFVAAGNENGVLAGSGSHGDHGHDKWRHHDSGDVDATQTVDTKVTVSSEANGGSVSDSNNAWAGNGGENTATANGRQDSETTGGNGQSGKEHSHHGWSWWKNHGGDATSYNHQDVDAENNVDNSAHTGDIDVSGGTSTVDVIAGNGNTLYCTSKSGDVTCSQNITTIINIISQANGGSVSCSNNASAGNAGSAVCPVTNNTTTPAKAAAPAAHKAAAAPAAKKAPVSANAQPSGTLAFTGAETSLPLTLGLLALGVGGALTLAGRRRETATV
jgi:hypothetical protein